MFVRLREAKERRSRLEEAVRTVVDDPDCCLSFEFVGDFIQVYTGDKCKIESCHTGNRCAPIEPS